MDIQYRFTLTFKTIIFRRPTLKPTIFRITLVDAQKELEQTSNCFQTEQITLIANQKQQQLNPLPLFKFKTTKATSHNNFYIKYELKDINDHPNSIAISTFQMISQFQHKKKSLFIQKYQAKNLDLDYQIKVAIYQQMQQGLANKQLNHSEIQQQQKVQSSKKNTITRGRPPLLNIAKLNSNSKSEASKGFTLGPVPYSQTPLHKDIIGSPFLTNKQSFDQKQSGLPLQKKISSLPLSQIEKVNELLKTHHRPTDDHKQQSWSISYKLKIVLVMIIIGIVSLAYDTFNDRFTSKTHEKKHHKKSHNNKKEKSKVHKATAR